MSCPAQGSGQARLSLPSGSSRFFAGTELHNSSHTRKRYIVLMGLAPYYWAASWSVPGESLSHLISSVTHLELGSTLSSFLSATPSNHASAVLLILLPSPPQHSSLPRPFNSSAPPGCSLSLLQPPTPVSAPSPSNPVFRACRQSQSFDLSLSHLTSSVAPTVFQVKVRLHKRPIRSCSFKFPPAS